MEAQKALEIATADEAAEALATPPPEAPATQPHATQPHAAQPTQPHAAPPTEPLAAPPTQPHAVAGDQAPLRLADGIELIGEFEDSGFKKAPFIARRADGQVVQMPEMLYRLAEQVDGQANLEQVAKRFGDAIKRKVEPSDARMLIDEQLRPLGIVAQEAGHDSVELNKVDPLLALKLRTAVIPDGAVRSLTTVFRPLFLAPVVTLVVLGMLGLDGWLLFVHGISQSLRHVLYQPALMLMLIGGVILATAFHEIGHATACRYGGAKPGVMGVGIYIVWPAFYTDITDAYRLGKWGRLRTDLGGIYFNAIFALVVAGVYAVTSFAPLLLLIVLQNFAILQQALPLLRLDGYYILSDLTGVPDIYLRIRSVLASLIPGRPSDDRVTALKSWVRWVVSAYVVFLVAFLGVTLLALVINLPRVAATGYDSAVLRFDAVGPAFGHGQALTGILDVVQMLFLVLPGAGLVYTAFRVLRRATTGAYGWSAGHPERQVGLGLLGAAAIAVAVFSWWPNGEYRPIQPRERGTLTGLVHQLAALPTGRPSLTVQRARELGGAPAERDHGAQPSTSRGTPGQPASRPAAHTSTAANGGSSTNATTTTPTTSTMNTTPNSTTPSPTSTTTSPTSSTTTTTTTTPDSTTTSPASAPSPGSASGAAQTSPTTTSPSP